MNLLGLKTLFIKEVKRFSKVWLQTLFSPLVTTALYFLVFGVALGARLETVGGVSYVEFVVPGLMMLAMISNAFLNTSSSLFQSKINGTLVDMLAAPIGTPEILLAYLSAAVLRAVAVGAMVWMVAAAFVGTRVAHPLAVVWFTLTVTITFAALGLFAAMWAEKFDQLSILPNFVLQPLTFLGGVFYAVEMLPEPWQTITHANPILYMVNGLRYGLLGVSDVPVASSAIFCGVATVVSVAVVWRAVDRGYKLRS
jgi:ABC-2 type transport system permease protein